MLRLDFYRKFFALFSLLILISGTFSADVFAKEKRAQKLVLVARLFKIEAFMPESIVDALDEVSVQGTLPTATAIFLIKKVARGELPPLKPAQGVSTWNQAQDAFKEKNFLKIVTMDFENPHVEHESHPRWFAVGIQSPLESFNVISWSDLPTSDFRLTFTQDSARAGWVLTAAEKVA